MRYPEAMRAKTQLSRLFRDIRRAAGEDDIREENPGKNGFELIQIPFIREEERTPRACLFSGVFGGKVWLPIKTIKSIDWERKQIAIPRWVAVDRGVIEP